jgi:outer membrane protein
MKLQIITKQIIALIIIFSSISNSNFLYAQDTSSQTSIVKWNLQACIDYANQNNIQLNTVRLNSQSSRQELLLAKAAKLPGVSGAASQYYTHSKNANPVVGGFQTQSSLYGNYSVNAAWILYNGGYINDFIKQNQLSVQSANLDVLETQNDITLSITQSYLNILEAKENIVYVKDLLTTSQAQLKHGQQLYDAGSIAMKDLASLKAQLATDNYTLVAATNTLRQNKLVLKQLLQLPVDTAFDIPEPDTLIAAAKAQNLDSAEYAAMQTRPEIKNGELGVQIAEVGLLEAKTGYKPTLSFAGSLSTGYSNDESNNYFKQLDNNFFQSAGLNLSIPIFTKRINKTNVELAKINIQQADLSLKNTKTTLSQSVEQAYINVENAQSQYDAAVEQLNATQESYRIATEELNVGGINVVDYLVQKNLYVQALQAYIQAKYNAVISVKIYDFYTGSPIKL